MFNGEIKTMFIEEGRSSRWIFEIVEEPFTRTKRKRKHANSTTVGQMC